VGDKVGVQVGVQVGVGEGVAVGVHVGVAVGDGLTLAEAEGDGEIVTVTDWVMVCVMD